LTSQETHAYYVLGIVSQYEYLLNAARSREAVLDKPSSSRREYVISLHKAGLTYAEIGRRLGITRERARQIPKWSLLNLASTLRLYSLQAK